MSTAPMNSLLRSLALPNKSSMLTAGANLKYRLLSALRSSCLGASYLIKVRHNSLPDKFELNLLSQLYHRLKSQACSRHPNEHRIQSSNICGDCKILISHQVLCISAQSEELFGVLLYWPIASGYVGQSESIVHPHRLWAESSHESLSKLSPCECRHMGLDYLYEPI